MNADFELRRGTLADSHAVFELFEETLYDLQARMGQKPEVRFDDPTKLARMWRQRKDLYEHLADVADEFWVAEQKGLLIGFARSVRHEKARELNEFYVKPGVQTEGVGKALLEKVMPKESGVQRTIVASLDVPAQVRYIKEGIQHRFMVMYYGKRPERQPIKGKLEVELMRQSTETLEMLNKIDRKVLGFSRPKTHSYLLSNRRGYKYLRPDGAILGYGYVGIESGPFAMLDAAAYPDVLAHAETEAADHAYAQFGLEVPTVNTIAVNCLLARKFRMDSFMTVVMSRSDLPMPECYVLPSPPFFI